MVVTEFPTAPLLLLRKTKRHNDSLQEALLTSEQKTLQYVTYTSSQTAHRGFSGQFSQCVGGIPEGSISRHDQQV